MTVMVRPDPLEVLADPSSPLGPIMKAVEDVEGSERYDREVSIGLSSNATISLLGVFLRRHALLNGVKMRVHQGSHDDVVGDIDGFAREGVDNLLLLPFFDNLLPAFESQVGHVSPDVIAEKEADVRARYRLAFDKAREFQHVFVGGFHRFGTVFDATTDAVAEAIDGLNRMLRDESEAFPNVRLIDTAEIVRVVGWSRAFDRRFYFRGKAPYSTAFLNELARRITAGSRAFGSHYLKALVLDCDNTLWGGVIGEDLMAGVKLDPFDYPGNVFWHVQNELVALEHAGVLLCLCSKNNPEDVEEVFARHPSMVLKSEHIILKKLNWTDKSTNVREIAETLNIGLDSLAFLDDSDFECEGMRTQLPMVRTFQVPAILTDYPVVIEEIKELFLAGGVSRESRSKTEQYRQRAEAEKLKEGVTTNEEFLASLGLQIELSRDAVGSIPRISELTMKSNQFNLTTRRYSVSDIGQFMESADATVYSVVVGDKFGSAGLTGVIVVRWEGGEAVVDSFLLSCRVIGRGVEFAVWDVVLRDARARGCSLIRAEYRPTARNAQVRDFFDRLGLPLVASHDDGRRYETTVDRFPSQNTPWIEVTCA